jgi:sigma-B regulation protein RsbU (phosphoserine phosphatase)
VMGEDKAKILVVDDDYNIRLLYCTLLEKDGYKVSQAPNGETAIRMMQTNQYDLILSDLQMLELGGIDVLKAAKAHDPMTQVLIFTGMGSINSAVEAMKLGAFEYMTKPVDNEAFRIKVKNALEQRKLQLRLQEQQKEIDEHHKMIERDLRLAEQVQTSLVPSSVENERFAIGVEYRPTIGVGGDFADIYYGHGGRLYITVIDVTGHGITAALLVNRVCSEVRNLVREHRQPKDIINKVNDFFFDSFSTTGMFLTMMSVLVDMDNGELIYSGSAHPAALLCRAKEKKFIKLDSQNSIIGFERSKAQSYIEDRQRLFPGDKIVLYTDGIIEAENQKQEALGLQGFLKILGKHIKKPVSKAASSIIMAVQTQAQYAAKDDIYLIIAEIK